MSLLARMFEIQKEKETQANELIYRQSEIDRLKMERNKHDAAHASEIESYKRSLEWMTKDRNELREAIASQAATIASYQKENKRQAELIIELEQKRARPA